MRIASDVLSCGWPFISHLFAPTKKLSNAKKRVQLQLEDLGDRVVLATYTWISQAGGNWSDINNWQTDAFPVVAPGQNDQLVFTNTHRSDSTADIANVGSLTVPEGFGATVTIP